MPIPWHPAHLFCCIASSGRFSIHRVSTAGDSYLYKLLFLQGLSLTID